MSKERLIREFTKLKDSIDNYEKHLQIADELEIRRDMKKFADAFEEISYGDCAVEDIVKAIHDIPIYDGLSDIEMAYALKMFSSDKAQVGCHYYADNTDVIGDCTFCDECEFDIDSPDCIKFRKDKYYSYGLYTSPKVEVSDAQ